MIAGTNACARRPMDYWLFGSVLVLVVIGLLMVLDSSYVQALRRPDRNGFYFLSRQAIGAGIGLLCMAITWRIGYMRLKKWAFPLILVGMALLVIVLVPGLGHQQGFGTRWIGPKLFRFQPSEFAKLCLLIYTAKLLSLPRSRRHGRYSEMLWLGPPLVVAVIYLVLIEREPDMGTAVVLFLAILSQVFAAGIRKRHLLMLLGFTALAAVLMVSVHRHRSSRIDTFLHPERAPLGAGFQVRHAALAVGSGSWFGVGWGKGREKFYLPEANSDFVFSTMAEELGFCGVMPVFLLFIVVGMRGFMIAERARDPFGALLAIGLAGLISWQALINIAVATATVPATGVPLPFISYGSSSLIVMLSATGILLSIAQHSGPPGRLSANE